MFGNKNFSIIQGDGHFLYFDHIGQKRVSFSHISTKDVFFFLIDSKLKTVQYINTN